VRSDAANRRAVMHRGCSGGFASLLILPAEIMEVDLSPIARRLGVVLTLNVFAAIDDNRGRTRMHDTNRGSEVREGSTMGIASLYRCCKVCEFRVNAAEQDSVRQLQAHVERQHPDTGAQQASQANGEGSVGNGKALAEPRKVRVPVGKDRG
jgi:hypothetical protein